MLKVAESVSSALPGGIAQNSGLPWISEDDDISALVKQRALDARRKITDSSSDSY